MSLLPQPSGAAAPAGTPDPRWTAVMTRDAAAGFFYGVRTTGIYCRPSCASRRPRRENVAFFADAATAEAAGYRPCRRCRPDGPSDAARKSDIVAAACLAIERATSTPDLKTLAAKAGLSPSHFHRMFKGVTGLTPKRFAAARRQALVRASLAEGSGVTEAIYAAGYGSSSRFYEQADAMLGMAPVAFREGGTDTEIWFAVGECTLGTILVARSRKGICAISLGDDPDTLLRDLQGRFPRATLIGGDAAFEDTVAKVVGLIEAPALGHDLSLDVRGTAFQQRVWAALRAIPLGETISYAELARRVGDPRAVRAVAQACGANPVAVAIPCHRVVRSGGALAGYRWGVERKQALLAREAAMVRAAGQPSVTPA